LLTLGSSFDQIVCSAKLAFDRLLSLFGLKEDRTAILAATAASPTDGGQLSVDELYHLAAYFVLALLHLGPRL
jgi:hypothetical protein